MASIRVKFRKSTVNGKDGILVIQLIRDRKVKLISTRFRLFPWEWDAQRETITPDTADKARESYLLEVHMALEVELQKLGELAARLAARGAYTVDELAEHYVNNSLSGYLFPFMDRLISKLKDDNHSATAAIYRVARNSFHSFRKGYDVPISGIDSGLMKQYESFLKNNGVSMNSISCYMRVWRAAYNKAVEEGLTTQRYPFKNVYTGIARTVKRAIGEPLIVHLKRLDLSGIKELSIARDLFLFSFYTRGMSFIDMANLTHDDIRTGYLLYTRSKTKQNLAIKIEPCMEEIITRYRHETVDNYLLPIYHPGNRSSVSTLRTHNKRLKRISAMLSLDKPLTSYVSRHSWATIAMRKGIPLPVISEGMGHENEQTTRIYLDTFEQSTLDRANAHVIMP
ncbi:MAG: site-specific integrase [Tannerellaceae bacterium]|jgi:site-specific recombinase XerD|nr:site-specific integrase [Tannerellaceae bacterium]